MWVMFKFRFNQNENNNDVFKLEHKSDSAWIIPMYYKY